MLADMTAKTINGRIYQRLFLPLVLAVSVSGCALSPPAGEKAFAYLPGAAQTDRSGGANRPDSPAARAEAGQDALPDFLSVWGDATNLAVAPPTDYLDPELVTASPLIVGRFPGQTTLAKDHFDEVADFFDAYGEATVVFMADQEPDSQDLWDRIRANFELPDHNHRGIKHDLAWYARHQAYLDRVAERASPYLHFIVEEVERRDMPAEIALLPIVESAFQPFAYSHGRAAGIWQFIPSTGKLFGLKQNWWYDGRRDVVASTKAALTYLETLNKHFDGDWLLALAAYNSGEGTVRRAIRKNKRRGKPTDFWSLDLPRETRGYVPKLLAIANIVSDPEAYGVRLVSIPDEPFFDVVDTGSQIDLALAADLAEISMRDLYTLNPGFNRWATDPKGPHRLLVPLEKAGIFEEKLADLSEDSRIQWERHSIRRGETLLAIAEKYRTTVDVLKKVNHIRGNIIREGDNLVIPVATKNLASYTLSAEQRLRATQNTSRSGRQKVVHVVRAGDTLWDLSRKYGVSVRALAKWNGMAPRDMLKTGQKLVVWTKHGRLASATFSPHDSKVITQKIGYRVKRGDSLARISQKFKVSVNDLMKWNGLHRNKYLQPGQHLTLYVDVTAQAGI